MQFSVDIHTTAKASRKRTKYTGQREKKSRTARLLKPVRTVVFTLSFGWFSRSRLRGSTQIEIWLSLGKGWFRRMTSFLQMSHNSLSLLSDKCTDKFGGAVL